MSIITRTAVTAVKLYKNYVLAGIGSYINVYEKQSMKFLQRLNGLNAQKIYGFVPSENEKKIIVFGGKQFIVITLEDGDEASAFRCLFEPVLCDDWLHSAVWIDGDRLAVLTAHNVTQLWTTVPGLVSRHPSRHNSILYSGLLLPLQSDVLVLAGTVFSEVIIHCCGEESWHHLKGHRGVIFSISCAPQKNLIVTTSDDRSVRIWGIVSDYQHNTKEYWLNATITCRHEVYGHIARVMRSCITENNIISVGEDSLICYWDFEGTLKKKVPSHQNGCIWSVDADDCSLVTGGGDCAVILHPLTVADYDHTNKLITDINKPKKVILTARNNVIVLNENDELVYQDLGSETKQTYKLNHNSTFKLIAISSCKQIVAVADMGGKLDVFIENCKDNASLLNIINTNLNVGKVLSMQWAGNRHLVLCNENGMLSVIASKGNSIEDYEHYYLPPCKERWLTASAINIAKDMLVVGDRCGNIHVYTKGHKDPIKTFSKVHGRYGPTSISINNKDIVSTGRDGTIKKFAINNFDVKLMNCREFEFQWVEKFLDKNENLVCGFQERIFVVYDIKSNCKVLEVPCGGGHRSWDAVRYIEKVNNAFEEFVNLIYIKNSEIHLSTFEMSKIASKNIVNGSHCKEINCLKTSYFDDVTFYITGGEDTTLRISKVDKNSEFRDEIIFKHLSSIRALKTYDLGDNKWVIFSAGGRAQICVKIIEFNKENNEIEVQAEEVIDYLIKGTDKERKGNQNWRNCTIDFDPETRIMDIDFICKNNNDFLVFAVCSDAHIRIFKFNYDVKQFKFVKEVKHHKTCILKTNVIEINDKYVLATCTTRGQISFFEVNTEQIDIVPILDITANKSGINSFSSKIINNSLIIATGGDDNAIHLILLQIKNQNNQISLQVLHEWNSDRFHSSQITGLIMVDDILVSTAIDQRITVFKWKAEEKITCSFVKQITSGIADIQGMELVNNISGVLCVCVFGKGMEVVEVGRSS